MRISDSIALLIERMLTESDGYIEIQRNDLAGRLGCVPSQINYVITSRFTPERGYIIESRRGGGGYIRIIKKQMGKDEYLTHFLYAIGDSIDMASCTAFVKNLFDNELITEREKYIISGALSAIPDDTVRANVFKQIVLAIMN